MSVRELPDNLQRILGTQLGEIFLRVVKHGSLTTQVGEFNAAAHALVGVLRGLNATVLTSSPTAPSARNLSLSVVCDDGTLGHLKVLSNDDERYSPNVIHGLRVAGIPTSQVLAYNRFEIPKSPDTNQQYLGSYHLTQTIPGTSVETLLQEHRDDRSLIDKLDSFINKVAAAPIDTHLPPAGRNRWNSQFLPSGYQPLNHLSMLDHFRDALPNINPVLRWIHTQSHYSGHPDLVPSNIIRDPSGTFIAIDPGQAMTNPREFTIAQHLSKRPNFATSPPSVEQWTYTGQWNRTTLNGALAIFATIEGGRIALGANCAAAGLRDGSYAKRFAELSKVIENLSESTYKRAALDTMTRGHLGVHNLSSVDEQAEYTADIANKHFFFAKSRLSEWRNGITETDRKATSDLTLARYLQP